MEERFRYEAEEAGKGPAETYQLTPDQELQITKAIHEANLESLLRDIVSSFGLLQYLIAPAAFVLSLRLAVANRQKHVPYRLFAVILACLALPAIILMFYRGYFTAIGWD